jgi:hypothetical protein
MRPFTLCFSVCILCSVCLGQWEPAVRLTYEGNPARIWANNGRFLAVTQTGVMQAVWWEGRDGTWEIYGKRSTDTGTTWEPDRNLSSDPDTSWCPSLAAAGNELHLAYKDKQDSWGVFYKRSTAAGATWSSETAFTRFSPVRGFGGCVTDAASDSFVHVLWSVYHGAYSQVSYLRSLDRGIHWESEVLLTHDSARSEDPSVALSGSAVHVSWWDTRNGPGDVYYERSTDCGASWGLETRLTSDSAIVYEPTIAAADSMVHIAWVDRRSGPDHYQVYYMRSTDAGATWEAETRLCDNPGSCQYPVLAATGSNVHVAWYDDRDGNYQIYYRRSVDGGETWEPEFQLSQTLSNATNPALALSGGGVHVVWSDDSTGTYQIYYRRNLTGSVGVEERFAPHASRITPATIVRGVLDVTASSVVRNASYVMHDISGREVMSLLPGVNDVSRLARGVYFVRAGGDESSSVRIRKVAVLH